MNEIANLLPSLLAGSLLGIIFFGGLWLTVQRGLHLKNSALIFMGSFIIRMAIMLLGFYYVGKNNPSKMLICLAGFLMLRWVITRITKKQGYSKISLNKKANYET